MKIFPHVNCPYCGKNQAVTVETDSLGDTDALVYCDIEEGGCDSPFVVTLTLRYDTQVYAIPGKEPPDRGARPDPED